MGAQMDEPQLTLRMGHLMHLCRERCFIGFARSEVEYGFCGDQGLACRYRILAHGRDQTFHVGALYSAEAELHNTHRPRIANEFSSQGRGHAAPGAKIDQLLA